MIRSPEKTGIRLNTDRWLVTMLRHGRVYLRSDQHTYPAKPGETLTVASLKLLNCAFADFLRIELLAPHNCGSCSALQVN